MKHDLLDMRHLMLFNRVSDSSEVMFIDECVNELKLNEVCSQNNMRDCADAVQRNRIDGCRFLVSSLSWSNLRFWSILTNVFSLQTSAKSNQCWYH